MKTKESRDIQSELDDALATLEKWRDVAQGLAREAEEATSLIECLTDELKTANEQRRRLFELCRKQHDALVEAGLIDSEETMQ